MNNQFIYIIGQPDLKSDTVKNIHELGYKAGLLYDTRLNTTYEGQFDRIINVDFTDLESELPRLKSLNLEATGFLCTYENYIVAKARISRYFNTRSLSLGSARACTDKALMRQAFINTDPSISPNFSIIDGLASAESFAHTYGYPLIIKPTGLVKSLLVMRCNNHQELTKNVQYALGSIDKLYQRYRIYDRKPQLIIEECLKGAQFSIAAFVDENGDPHFAEGVVSLTTAQDIGKDDTYIYKRQLPAIIKPELTAELLRISAIGIRSLDMRSSAAHIELMSTSEGVKIIEIGARIGGYRPRMYQYCSSINLVQQDIRLALGQKPELANSLSQYCAVYELFPDEEGIFTSINGTIDYSELTYYRETTSRGNRIGPAKNGYKATVIIIVTSHDMATFSRLCRDVETLSVEVS